MMASTTVQDRWLATGLSVLLVACTLGEGGDAPWMMRLVHGFLYAGWAVILLVVLPSRLYLDRFGRIALSAFIAFWSVVLLGGVLAPYSFAVITQLQELAAFTAVLVAAALIGPKLTGMLTWPLLAAGALQGLYIIYQRVALEQFRPPGTFLNTNHVGAWLVGALLLGLGCWRPGPGKGEIIGRVILSIPALVGLFVCGSRGAFIGLLAGLAVMTGLARRKLPGKYRIGLLVTVCIGAVVVAGGLLVRFSTADPYALHRIKIWKATVSMIADSPWLGTGPGQFAYKASPYQFDDGEKPLKYDRVFRRPHSDWLRPAAEHGLPAAVLLLVALGSAAWSIGRRYRRGSLGPQQAGAIAALAALLAHAGVENLSERPAVYLLAATLVGALMFRPRVGSKRRMHVPTWIAATVVMLVAFVAGDEATYRAFSMTVGERGQAIAKDAETLDKALRYNPLQPYLWMRYAEKVGVDGSLDSYARAREAAEHAVRLHPDDEGIRLRLARLEARACRDLFRDLQSRERAERRYDEAIKVSRPNAILYLEKGEFLFGTSDFEGALTAAGLAVELEPESVTPRLLQARAVLMLGREGARYEAGRFLAEAERLSAKHGNVERQNEYTAVLLDPDPEMVEWVSRRLR